MSKIVKKWKKVVGGCTNPKNNRGESLIENDFLAPAVTHEEFIFEHRRNKDHGDYRAPKLELKKNIDAEFPIYNEYDNLGHGIPTERATVLCKRNELKESTNVSYARNPLKRLFYGKTSEKSEQMTENVENIPKCSNFTVNFQLAENVDSNPQSTCIMQEAQYCEIQDFSSIFSDNQPLIELNKQEELRKSRLTDSKINLFIKTENDEQLNISTNCDNNNNQATQISTVVHKIKKVQAVDSLLYLETQNLTDLRTLESFGSRSEAVSWYLSLLCDRMSQSISLEKTLDENEQLKRMNVIKAHLLYSRNYYEMRTRSTTMSVDTKSQLDRFHPCVIAIVCLLDSDAVRIVDSHACSCDSYMYLFATRVKFCAWKTKLYVILKRPKRSSFERLNLIEDLTNCRKLMAH